MYVMLAMKRKKLSIYTYRLFSSSSFREICFHGVEKFEGKGRDGGKKGEIEESDRFFFSRTVLRNRIRKISRPSLRKGIGGDDVSA